MSFLFYNYLRSIKIKKVMNMRNFLLKVEENPRLKLLGIFLIIFGFVGETPLRKISHFWAESILFLIGRDISGVGKIIEEWFSLGAPIILVYIPATITVWLIIRDGFQKLDWIFAPILIGIILKGGVYGITSFYYKSGEFWQLLQADVSGVLLWFFILTFIISAIVGFVIWFKEIL